MTEMHVDQRGLTLIEDFEGFSSVQYNDGTGVMTIGYGTTAADVSPLPSFLSRAQAQALLARKLADKYEPAVRSLGVPLNQNQFDALVSLAYNVGPGVVGWQIGSDLRARNYNAASADFMHYVYAGGQMLQGLVNRRRAERVLFDTPYTPPVPPDPYHYLWFDDTVRHPENTSERGAVMAYDRWRRMQTPHRHPHRENIEHLQDQMSLLANRLTGVIESSKDANSDHRGWRLDQMRERIAGRRMVP